MRRLLAVVVVFAGCRTGNLNSACSETSDCNPGLFCVSGACNEVSCHDDLQDGVETGVDCGGNCAPCASGAQCQSGSDCLSRVCNNAQCSAPSCADAMKNGQETDTDCGGGCPACGTQKKCKVNEDCASGICANGLCVAPSCTDAVENEGESDIDCGGNACRPCTPGQKCAAASDCDSGVCDASACTAPACTDGVKNGNETDIDCGGACNQKCELGKACSENDDCASDVCNNGVCVDCVSANDCLRGTQSAQCVSYVCDTNNTCQATAETPAQTAYDCQQVACNADHSLSLKADANDYDPDTSGNCYGYACENCTATSCTKVVVFEPTDTPPQVAGDCHAVVCVNASPLPHASTVVDDTDPPTGQAIAACHGPLICQNGQAVSPVLTSNVPPSQCPTDYCDGSGNLHTNTQAIGNACVNDDSCSTNLIDGCGFAHNCYYEETPCSFNFCGSKPGLGPCSGVSYSCGCSVAGDACVDNMCVPQSTGSSGGGGGSSGGVTGGCPAGSTKSCSTLKGCLCIPN